MTAGDNSDGHLTDFERAGRITASLVGAILRHDPLHSQKWAWRVITGREPPKEDFTGDLARGVDNEPNALEAGEIELGVLFHPGRFVCHPTIPWLGGSPDGFLIESREVKGKRGKVDIVSFEIPVEVKCPRKIHEALPLHYYDQVQCQMECCNADEAVFISWTEETQRVQRVKRDAAWWKENYPLLKQFFDEYVVKDVEPPRAKKGEKKTGKMEFA